MKLGPKEWLVILVAPLYALFLAIGALLGDSSIGFPRSVQPNIFIGSIALVPLVFTGLPLHSLWQHNFRTVPALTALFAAHLAYGLAICLILGLWAPVRWSFAHCVTIFPSLSFALLAGAWLGAAGLRSDPMMAPARLAVLTLRNLAAGGVAGLVVGPSIIFVIMGGINAWRHPPA